MNETIETAQAVLDLYEEIRPRTESEAVAIAILEEVGKYRRGEMASNNRGGKQYSGMRNPTAPATDAQVRKLGALGVVVPQRCTKQEASALIDANIR